MSEAGLSDGVHESLAKRLILFAVGGALGGFVTAPIWMAPDLAMRVLNERLSVLEGLNFYSPLDDPFWVFFTSHLEVFVSAPLAGVLFGVLAGVFARGRRTGIQVLKIAMWYGSIYAAVSMLSVLANLQFNFKGLFIVLVFLVVGFVFGGATGFFTLLADKVLRKLQSPRTAETNQRPN